MITVPVLSWTKPVRFDPAAPVIASAPVPVPVDLVNPTPDTLAFMEPNVSVAVPFMIIVRVALLMNEPDPKLRSYVPP